MTFEPGIPAEDLDHVLGLVGDLFGCVGRQRVFITGGTGFFGIWLVETLLWANDRLGLDVRVTVLSRDPGRFQERAPHLAEHRSLTLHRGGMADFEFPAGEFGHIIHAATEAYPLAVDRWAAFAGDLVGTRRVLEFARACACRCLLFTSSGAIYGKQPPELTHLSEEYGGAPDVMDSTSGYGQAKRASEFLCSLQARLQGLEIKIARCFAFVGPHLPLDSNFAIGNFIRDALLVRPIRVLGDGTAYRSYLYAADLAVWLWTILLKGRSCRPYNVGSDEALTIVELAREVTRALAPDTAIHVAQQRAPGEPATRYVPSILRARDELGLRPRISLADALRRTASWWKSRDPGRFG